MRTILQVLAANDSPRHPKVGDKIMFVKHRSKGPFGGNGIHFGHARVEEIIDANHIRVVMIEKEFWPEFGEEGKRILTWSEKYRAWRGRQGNKVLS